METNVNPDQVKKWWQVIKTIIEVIIAALTGAVTVTAAQSCGVITSLTSLIQ